MTARMQVPFTRPAIDEADVAAVVETLRSGWITTGAAATRLEDEFRRISGAPEALALTSATAALHLALCAWRIGEGDEVILPALTFSSCAGVVLEVGATSVLADVCEDDLTIDPDAVESLITPRTRVIMPVHYGGQPARMDGINALAMDRDIYVLEDAAHAPGATYDGVPVGSLGDAAAFSLYATKNVTSGEGGVLVANDHEFIERARMLSLHGMSRDAWRRYAANGGSWRYQVEERGFKYNLSDLLAALGASQAARLAELNAERRRIADRYQELLAGVDAVETLARRPEVEHAWHLFVIKLRLDRLSIDRARFIESLRERGVATSVHFIPAHHHPAYAELRRGDLAVTERVFEQVISLPMYPVLSDEELSYVVESVDAIAREHKR
jgi:dTDP-4-amino-4,6-dideoxygalactose transaminase